MRNRQEGSARLPEPPRRANIELDPATWKALGDIAARQNRSVHELITAIARDSLTIAIRLYIDEFARSDRRQT